MRTKKKAKPWTWASGCVPRWTLGRVSTVLHSEQVKLNGVCRASPGCGSGRALVFKV